MLLLDRNNEPTSTVYYLAAIAHGCLVEHDGIDAASLYTMITGTVIHKEVNFDFFIMALDFLFLLGKIYVDEKGELHVY